MPLNILVVDDSALYRGILCDIIKGQHDTKILGTAENGVKALEVISSLQPDLVFLDINMPEMDGLETLKNIKARYPKITVVMVSSENRTQADITIKALSSGAYDFIPKPDSENIQQTIQELKNSLEPIIEILRSEKEKTEARQQQLANTLGPQRSAPFESTKRVNTHFDVVAIAVSTGGPDALQKLIPQLPDTLNVPIVIVQHMPAVFTASLADHLNKRAQLTVKEAEHGETLEPNTVYIAPGGFHMEVHGNKLTPSISINSNPPENCCRPAADVLFRSLPSVYQGHILSIVLTGIGADGKLGVEKIKDAGGYCLSQSEKTCVVYGMPRSVADSGLSDEVLDLVDIAPRVQALLNVKKQLLTH
jgi:two-component system, chemotaxis family, protein-glutamate methylesterase/glutaminase